MTDARESRGAGAARALASARCHCAPSPSAHGPLARPLSSPAEELPRSMGGLDLSFRAGAPAVRPRRAALISCDRRLDLLVFVLAHLRALLAGSLAPRVGRTVPCRRHTPCTAGCRDAAPAWSVRWPPKYSGRTGILAGSGHGRCAPSTRWYSYRPPPMIRLLLLLRRELKHQVGGDQIGRVLLACPARGTLSRSNMASPASCRNVSTGGPMKASSRVIWAGRRRELAALHMSLRYWCRRR